MVAQHKLFTLLAPLVVAGAVAATVAANDGGNLARRGRARSWLPNSVASVPTLLVNDGDPLSFWGSNEPTTDPPKDIGVEWDQPQTFSVLRVKFHSLPYTPAQDGWRLESRRDDSWERLQATVDAPECSWWTFRFPSVRSRAVRLVVTRYSRNRPAVQEFEVYATDVPRKPMRRPPVCDGAFWAFHYEGWAKHFATDAALADEVDAAHRVGLDTIILYTLTGSDGTFSTVLPDTAIPQSTWWKGRAPLEAILTRADALGMQVYVSDTAPTGYGAPPANATPEEVERTAAQLRAYREQLLARAARHRCVRGYYINFECAPFRFANQPRAAGTQSETLARFVKSRHPTLAVVQPVGLYSWRDAEDGPWRKVTPKELETWWRPYIETCRHVDAFMVIDGVGTTLAPLTFTDLNQACIRDLCDEFGKQMWTDVECAMMCRAYGYRPMSMRQFAQSLHVAARHADTIVCFCYVNYMSPNNGREDASRLYEDYEDYRRQNAYTPVTLHVIRDQLRKALGFWTAPERVDREHGGFLTWIDADGTPTKPDAPKPLIPHLRMLYAHAVASRRAQTSVERERLQQQFDQGMSFLLEHYRDPKRGGWFSEVSAQGQETGPEKKTVDQAYVLYVMGEIHGHTGDRNALRLAEETFRWLDSRAHDTTLGGYLERCDLPADTPENARKSIGTNMHMALGLAGLCRHSPAPLVRERLAEVLRLLTTGALAPGSDNGYMFVTRDWKPSTWAEGTENQQTLYGHNAELAWYLLRAARTLGTDLASITPWLERVSRAVIHNGLMPDGGVHVWGPVDGKGHDPDDIRWWPQTEAMVMLARMHELTGDESYLTLFRKTARFTLSQLAVDASGAWLGGLDRRTGERQPRGGWAWKSGLHVIRCMLECEDVLSALETARHATEE